MKALPVALVLATLIAVATILFAIEWRGHERGKKEAEAAAAERDNDALRENSRALDAMHRRVEAQERTHAAELSKLAVNHQGELKRVQADRDGLSADLRAARRLRQSQAAANRPDAGDGVRVPEAPAGPAAGVCTAAGGELREEAESDLVALAGDADEVTIELGLCWAVVRKDRELQGAPMIYPLPRIKAGDG